MIAPKKFRFGERQLLPAADGAPAPLVLTAEDEANLDTYVVRVGETIEILRQEIAAIKKGELKTITNLFDDKSRSLKWLELHTPLIEPFLDHAAAKQRDLRMHMANLKESIEENGALLSRMAITVKTILREHEKILNRNGLGGVYAETGEKVSVNQRPEMKIDREF
ncbi:flagellar biosynthesis protein FlgI [Sulfitobacter sp. JB4-11]|uniref:flagellar biosynthesis protein FlgI n=1 Tax=Sulfitobacter rhodophyticola TaxID=3238304 RepID=UPI00351834D0